jgi:hypothetical protein
MLLNFKDRIFCFSKNMNKEFEAGSRPHATDSSTTTGLGKSATGPGVLIN